jgi:DNA helicase-2/ATP-dependent DNA helicase PcrA
VIYDGGDQLSVIKKILKEKGNSKFSPSYYLYRISSAKNELIPPSRFLEVFSDFQAPQVQYVYDAYQKELKKSDALDFDDLLVKVIMTMERGSISCSIKF